MIGAHHGTASDTEIAAAVRIGPFIGTAREKVLTAIRESANGLTDYELAQVTGLRHYTAAPRRNELVQGGFVVDSGDRRVTDSGSKAIVWKAA